MPAPRNGLERLLARGRRENLIPAGQGAGFEAWQALDHPAGPARHTAPAAELALALRDLRTGRPPAGDATAAPEPEAFARALTDLLRREARSAGIDLKGGR